MRIRALVLTTLCLSILACEARKEEPVKREEPKAEVAEQKDEEYALAESKGCFACHDMDKRKVGPSYKEVAERYKGDPKALEELVKSIVKGSMGKWGSIPMSPQPVSKEEARKLAEWILSLK